MAVAPCVIHLRTRTHGVAGGGRSRRPLAAALLACAGLGSLLAQPLVAAASGQANSSYQGVFSSSNPDGYQPTPATWTVGDSVAYKFTVTNTSMLPQMLSFDVYAWRITAIDGRDVSLGQPAMDETAVLSATLAGDEPVIVDVQQNASVLPMGALAFSESFATSGCGYWVIWAGQAGQPYGSGATTVLNAGATRATGCSTTTPRPPGPTATPRPVTHPHVVPPTTPGGRTTPTAGPSASGSASPSAGPSPGPTQAGSLPVGLGPADSGPTRPAPILPNYAAGLGPAGIRLTGPLLAGVVLLAAGLIGAAVALRARWLPLKLPAPRWRSPGRRGSA